jgi:hydrogenase maturation protease
VIAVIGCGNTNRSDDGVAAEVLRLLAQREITQSASRCRLLDAGTDGMAVMFAARGCRSLIIVDACRSGAEAGAIFTVPGGELEQCPAPSFTLHGFRWDNALFAGRQMFRDEFPDDVTVMLIEAASVALGTELTEPVACAARKVAARIIEMLAARLQRQDATPAVGGGCGAG